MSMMSEANSSNRSSRSNTLLRVLSTGPHAGIICPGDSPGFIDFVVIGLCFVNLPSGFMFDVCCSMFDVLASSSSFPFLAPSWDEILWNAQMIQHPGHHGVRYLFNRLWAGVK